MLKMNKFEQLQIINVKLVLLHILPVFVITMKILNMYLHYYKSKKLQCSDVCLSSHMIG